MIKAATAGLFVLGSILLVAWLIPSCTHETEGLDDFPVICFERDILPVFQNGCASTGCHDQAGQKGGYVLTDFEGIRKGITPGLLSKSPVYQAIIASSFMHMPPDHPLDRVSRINIRLWIEQGAGKTVCPDTTGGDTVKVRYPVCFERDLLPVFISSCALAGCHDNPTAQSGIRLTDYDSIMGDDDLVVPGRPDKSKLFRAITEDPDEDDFMPPKPNAPLPNAIIDSIYSWIRNGATNDDCPVICDTLHPVTYLDQVEPLVRRYCLGCHSGNNPSGGRSLSDYQSVRNAVEAGPLLESVRRTGSSPMPPSGALDECSVKIFEYWALDGFAQSKGDLR